MTPLQLMERLGGHILANKIRAEVDGKIVVIARLTLDNRYELTLEGEEIAGRLNMAEDAAAAVAANGGASIDFDLSSAAPRPASLGLGGGLFGMADEEDSQIIADE